jgi:hypothetical protein
MTTFVPGNGNLGTGGARDNKVYFKNSGTSTRSGFHWNSYRATLVLQSSSVPCGINAFGWFETNSTGTVIGNLHELFSGTGEPRYECALTPSPVGSNVTFTPTQYFGRRKRGLERFGRSGGKRHSRGKIDPVRTS